MHSLFHLACIVWQRRQTKLSGQALLCKGKDTAIGNDTSTVAATLRTVHVRFKAVNSLEQVKCKLEEVCRAE